jgi:hypothetical protein
MQYQGRILNLKEFQGPITIKLSTFENNSLGYDSCEAIKSVETVS